MSNASRNIIVKKLKGVKTYWVSEEYLLKKCTELSEDYLRTKARYRYAKNVPVTHHDDIMPDSGQSWRFAKLENTWYYDYDRIPDIEPIYYRSQLPAKEEMLKPEHNYENQAITSLYKKIKTAVESGYKGFMSDYAGHSQLLMLARSAAVLDVVVKHIEDELINTKSCVFWKELSSLIAHFDIGYLPKNYRRIQDKATRILQGEHITEVVSVPRANNNNALKYEDSELISWLIQMRGMGTNYTNSFIIRKIHLLCAMSGKNAPSTSWFNNYLATNEVKWITSLGRHGSRSKHGYLYKGYVPMKNALFAGDCWQADGTRVNFVPHTNHEGEEKSLYMICIRDVHSGDVLGVHFDIKENRWGYINALKMAVNNTGYLPYELVIDRFPGHNTEEWKSIETKIESYGTKISKAHTATGKAKLERWFGTLQVVFMQSSKYYYGEGVKSRRLYAHRSAEYLNKTKKEASAQIWDFDAAWHEAMDIIEAYRSTPYSTYSKKFASIDLSPKELHLDSQKPHTHNIDILTQVNLFGLEKEVQIKANGLITTEIMKVPYIYVIDDLEVIAKHRNVILNYDLDDLGKVYIYSRDKQCFLCEANEQREILLHGPSADYKSLAKVKQRMAKVEKYRKDLTEKLIGNGNEIDHLLEGLNSKDSSGTAEAQWLAEHIGDWNDHGQPRLVNKKILEDIKDDEPDLDITSIRAIY